MMSLYQLLDETITECKEVIKKREAMTEIENSIFDLDIWLKNALSRAENIEDLDQIIVHVKKAKRHLEKQKRELIKPRFQCAFPGCDNTFIRGSGSRPKMYCSNTHKVRGYTLGIRQ